MNTTKRFQTPKRNRNFARIFFPAVLIYVLGMAWFYRGIYTAVILISVPYVIYSWLSQVDEVIFNGEEVTLKSSLRTVKMPLSDIKKAEVVGGRAGSVILVYTQQGKFRVSTVPDYRELIDIFNRNETTSK